MSNLIGKFVNSVKRRMESRDLSEQGDIYRGNAGQRFKDQYLRDNPHMIDRNYSVKEDFRNSVKDMRYNEPKGKPQVARDVIDQTIEETEIYKRAKELILNAPTPVGYTDEQWQEAKAQTFDAQREQVGYGLDKYPEPLNADTWTIIETLDHSISEKIDDLHYSVMLRMKLEKEAREESEDTIKIYTDSGLNAVLTEEGRLRFKGARYPAELNKFENGEIKFNHEVPTPHWLLQGTGQGFMSGADHDGDIAQASSKHYRHGTGKCWCE